VPGIITGFALALLTGRLFLLQSTVHEHWQLPLPCVWQVGGAAADLGAVADHC
jgi:hypothetical protein